MRSGCCRCWFGKQPERWSGRSANGAGVGRRVCIERKRKGETLVSRRQDGPQFSFRPYTLRQKRRQLPPVEPPPLAGPTLALHRDLEDALGQGGLRSS